MIPPRTHIDICIHIYDETWIPPCQSRSLMTINVLTTQEPIAPTSIARKPSSTELLIKYYGYQPVSVGTGATAIREAVGVRKIYFFTCVVGQ